MKFLSARANERASEKVDRRGAEGGGRGSKRQQSSRAYIGEYEKGCDFFFRITSPSLSLFVSRLLARAVRACSQHSLLHGPPSNLLIDHPPVNVSAHNSETCVVRTRPGDRACRFVSSVLVAILTVARDESVISEAKAAIPCAPIAAKRKEREITWQSAKTLAALELSGHGRKLIQTRFNDRC